MDSKSKDQLDPALKATYDRIMGTGNPTPVPNAPPPPPVPATPAETSSPPPPPPKPAISAFQSDPHPSVVSNQPIGTPTPPPKKNHKLAKIIVVLLFLGLIGYVVFWLNFFNFTFPSTLPFKLDVSPIFKN